VQSCLMYLVGCNEQTARHSEAQCLQSQAALVTRIVDFGYDVQQAIEAPRWLMGRTWGHTLAQHVTRRSDFRRGRA
jgi:gamma-glutamyltranspeptidase